MRCLMGSQWSSLMSSAVMESNLRFFEMQVTAAFARKSYLHIINLITPLLISTSTWNLFQNLSLDLFHHDNKRKLFLHLMIFQEKRYMQVTAAFARKSYLHIINLITPLLISTSTWNLFQNLSLDLFHHDNKRKLFLHLMIFQEKRFVVLKIYFRLEFWYVYSFKEKVNFTIW